MKNLKQIKQVSGIKRMFPECKYEVYFSVTGEYKGSNDLKGIQTAVKIELQLEENALNKIFSIGAPLVK